MFQQKIKPYTECGEAVIQNVNRYIALYNSNNVFDSIPSVQKFKEYILTNSLAKIYLSSALKAIPEKIPIEGDRQQFRSGILFGKTIEEVMDLLNIIVQTPPCFRPNQYCGIVLYSFFMDLINTTSGVTFFSLEQVDKHLVNVFNDYANMLKSKESLMYLNAEEPYGWFSSKAVQIINYNDYECDPEKPHYGFTSWNDWFTRKLKAGARPIENINDPLVINHGTQNYPIANVQIPYYNLKATDQFWLKSSKYSLYDIFEAKKYGVQDIVDESFVGGTLYQGCLSPWCYHLWHAPVDGLLEEVYIIPGKHYVQNPNSDINKPNNYDNSQPFLIHVSTRLIMIINTENPLVGRVAIVLIGLGQVQTCISLIRKDERVKKGQVIGRFQFGGSSSAIIFDRKAKLEFNPIINDKEEGTLYLLSKKCNVNTWLAKVIVDQENPKTKSSEATTFLQKSQQKINSPFQSKMSNKK